MEHLSRNAAPKTARAWKRTEEKEFTFWEKVLTMLITRRIEINNFVLSTTCSTCHIIQHHETLIISRLFFQSCPLKIILSRLGKKLSSTVTRIALNCSFSLSNMPRRKKTTIMTRLCNHVAYRATRNPEILIYARVWWFSKWIISKAETARVHYIWAQPVYHMFHVQFTLIWILISFFSLSFITYISDFYESPLATS